MGVLSVLLIAAGAVLTFALERDPEAQGFDLNAIGIILMVVGVLGLVISLFLLSPRRRAPEAGTVVRERDTY